MKLTLRTLRFLLCAGAVSAAAGSAEMPSSPDAPPAEVGTEVRGAWTDLVAAEAKMGELIASRRLSEIPEQSRLMKAAVATILHRIRPKDEQTLKRLISAARELQALADRLSLVAATGNLARAETVHSNLHRYVDFIQKRLDSSGVRSGPGAPLL